MQRAKGELESAILGVLRDSGSSLTVKEVQAQLSAGTPAVTTVITVLERMRVKGIVDREAAGGRSFRYFATQSHIDHATASIEQALTLAGDRHAALLRLAGSLTDADREVLRRALDGN